MSTIKTLGIGATLVAVLGAGSFAVFSAYNKPNLPQTNNQNASQITQNTTSQQSPKASNNQGNNNQNNRPPQDPKIVELQTKYETQLTALATMKDEAGFITTYKKYQVEVKPLIDAQRAARQTINSSSTINQSSRIAPTETEQNDAAKKEYTRALGDLAAGNQFKIGNQSGRNGGNRGGNNNFNNSQFAPTISSTVK